MEYKRLKIISTCKKQNHWWILWRTNCQVIFCQVFFRLFTNSVKIFLSHSYQRILNNFRAYAAWCDNIDVDPELEQRERDVLEEYRSKLTLKDTVFDDPLVLKDGWIGEHSKSGINSWPSLNYLDIANYIGLKQPDFLRRMQSDYKQGKSFTYFACQFVCEICFLIGCP